MASCAVAGSRSLSLPSALRSSLQGRQVPGRIGRPCSRQHLSIGGGALRPLRRNWIGPPGGALAADWGAVVSFARSYVKSLFSRTPDPMALPGQEWWCKDTVAVVTGANKGIGYEIARQLAKAGLTTVLTARDPKLGQAALEQLKEEGLKVDFHRCDISDAGSVDELAKWLESTYGGLDVLVNNAGFAYKGNAFGPEEAKATLDINYTGTKNMCERMLPILKPSKAGARIVNVCSVAGKLSIVRSPLREQFADPQLTKEQLDKLMDKFVQDVAAGKHSQEGWPNSMYGVSKLGEATYTRILANELASRPDGKKVLVNACCPGYVKTDMSSQRGHKTPEQGADTPVFLALLPPDGPSGKWWSDRTDQGF